LPRAGAGLPLLADSNPKTDQSLEDESANAQYDCQADEEDDGDDPEQNLHEGYLSANMELVPLRDTTEASAPMDAVVSVFGLGVRSSGHPESAAAPTSRTAVRRRGLIQGSMGSPYIRWGRR